MPATMVNVAKKCLGTAPSPAAFLRIRELQEKIMDCYLAQGWKQVEHATSDPATQCRMLASYHYSGNPEKYRDTKKQTYRGRPYPSIAAYTKSVCKEILP